MAAITAANVTLTPVGKGQKEYLKSNVITMTFGNGVLTYPAGGIPLNLSAVGFPNQVRVVDVYGMSAGDGYVYKYDATNKTVRIYQVGAAVATPLAELSTSATPAATTLQLSVSGY